MPDDRRADPPVLRLRGIGKRFGAVVANDDVSLDLARGEVLALLGENGAGKSTLVSILFGHYRPDSGTIEVDGAPLPLGRPQAALAAGIGMVHQHSTLAENLSVLDNVVLGTEPLWRPWSARGAARARLLALARRCGFALDPDARVATLSVGERQRVEIVKALYRDARILILDEPTAVLTPAEAAQLFDTVGQLTAQGLAVIFISHKLPEVLRVSDRIAVLRQGRLVGTVPAREASREQLAAMMVGRDVAAAARSRTAGSTAGADAAPALRLSGVSAHGAGGRRIADVDLEVRRGEVVAIAGVSGNGQQVLGDLLCGLIAPASGLVEIAGRTLAARPAAWVAAGVARIPEDRQGTGAVGDLALWENAITEQLRTRFARWGGRVLRRADARAHAQALAREADVRGLEQRGVDTTARALSGGNLQKLVVARALQARAGAADAAPVLIVASQPTWGLDVGAVAAVHQRLLDAAAAGAGVLVISDDLDEILALADRIAVLHAGRLTAARPAPQWTAEAIGLAMAGDDAEARDAARTAH